MINKIIDFLPEKLRIIIDFFKIIKNDYGYFASLNNKHHYDQKPWFTYSALEFLNALNIKNKTVLEWGSGNSTFYWINRGLKVTSIETDPQWYRIIKDNLSNQVDIILQPKSNIIKAALNTNKKYDIILIDSWARLKCAHAAIKLIKDTGFIILDNSDWYKDAKNFLLTKNMIEIPFSGIGPGNGYTWTTSIFLSKSTRLNYLKDFRPKGSIVKYATN